MKKDLLAVLPTGYGYNPSRFARANSAFQKFAYSWQNSGLHEAPAYPRTRFCSGGKRQKTGSNKKNIGERSDLSCCPPPELLSACFALRCSFFIHDIFKYQYNQLIESLRSRFGHFTANDKLRFAVNGFTLPVCPYLVLKIRGW